MKQLYIELVNYMQAGGYVMPPLAIATLMLWYALGYRYMNLRRGSRKSVRELIQNGRDHKPENTGIINTCVQCGLQIASARKSYIRRYMDDAFYPFVTEMKRYQTLVTAIVVSAPLLGLLGTVSGMIETFDSLADQALFSQTGGIAGGISQALFTTQMGLAVSIPGMIVKGLLDKKQLHLEMEIAQIKDILCAEYAQKNESNAS